MLAQGFLHLWDLQKNGGLETLSMDFGGVIFYGTLFFRHDAQCRELRCGCVIHVECLLDWWKQSVETRPRREVESGILQLDCRKCKKTVSVPSYVPGIVNVVTKGEIQKAQL